MTAASQEIAESEGRPRELGMVGTAAHAVRTPPTQSSQTSTESILHQQTLSTAKTTTVSSQPPTLSFPPAGFVGVMAEIAEVYSQEYESAKEFLYLDGLALLGTLLSGRVRVDFGALTTQPRLYVLKVAKSGWRRKSTSTKL